MTGSETITANQGPLTGIRVIDLTSVIFGPYATQTLGDMGADVIKVEPPEGDIMRTAYPARTPGMSGVYLNCNRNKRGVVLNLRDAAAKDALLELIKTADVFVHSMRPAAIRKLGFDYETVKAAKPDIVYASAWGFRSSGPYADRPAYDDVIQGISGTTDLARRRGGESPDFAPMVMADKVAGLHAVSGITMALFHRERTGEGQQIEIPMFETVTSFNFANTSPAPRSCRRSPRPAMCACSTPTVGRTGRRTASWSSCPTTTSRQKASSRQPAGPTLPRTSAFPRRARGRRMSTSTTASFPNWSRPGRRRSGPNS